MPVDGQFTCARCGFRGFDLSGHRCEPAVAEAGDDHTADAARYAVEADRKAFDRKAYQRSYMREYMRRRRLDRPG